MRAIGNGFIEIKRARSHRILARVGTREREHILDNASQAACFVLKGGERLAILLGRTRWIRKSNFGFALQNCERRAEFVGSVGNETALAFEREIETIEKTIEGRSQAAQFVSRILHGKAVMQRGFTDAVGAGGHVGNRSEILAREEIAASRRQDDGDGNEPAQRDTKLRE